MFCGFFLFFLILYTFGLKAVEANLHFFYCVQAHTHTHICILDLLQMYSKYTPNTNSVLYRNCAGIIRVYVANRREKDTLTKQQMKQSKQIGTYGMC